MTFPPTAVAGFCLLLHRTITRYVALHAACTIVAYTTINDPEDDTTKTETSEEKPQDSQL